MPAIIALFITKSFFDGFFKEAGKDAYVAFKKSIAGLATKAAKLSVTVIKSARDKIEDASSISRTFSIHSESSSGIKIKFLFPAQASEIEYFEMIDSMLLLLAEDHSQDRAGRLSAILTVSRTRGAQLLVFNSQSRAWQLWHAMRKEGLPAT